MPIDRGKAKFFHGRKKELAAFEKLVTVSEKEKSGSVFLVQGSPGVSKSAFYTSVKRKLIKKHGMFL